MNKETGIKPDKTRDEFIKQVEIKENRKLRALEDPKQSVWMGFVKYGTIGWTVAIPMLIGIACGVWLDKNYPSTHSWTLSLMALGLFIGCAGAWRWVESEGMKIKKDSDEERGRK